MSAAANYAVEFYAILEKASNLEEHEGLEVPLFRGSLVNVWNEVGASNAYYTRVRGMLEKSGCIVVLQRGSAKMTSIVALLKPPDPAILDGHKRLTPAPDPAIMQARLTEIVKMIGGMDIRAIIGNFEERIDALEKTVKDLKREVDRIGKTPQKTTTRRGKNG
jgi:hypothetical protein